MNKIAERLKNGYERIVYPVVMGDTPIELDKMAKYDEDNNLIGYLSINELAQELGNLLVPMRFNNSGTLMHIRWSFDKYEKVKGINDEKVLKQLMKDHNLVDILDSVEAKDVIIGELSDNSFGVFGSYEYKQIPSETIEEVII